MRGHVLQPGIYDDETTRFIMWIIIGYGHKYFMYLLMSSAFTGSIIESKIALPTPTLGLLVKQLGMLMPIRVSSIPEKWKSQYTVHQVQENKQGTDKGYERGV